MILFIILRQHVTISVTVFSNLSKVTSYLLILQIYVKINKIASWTDEVIRKGNIKCSFLITGGILSGYWSLLALHLSGIFSLWTGTRPKSQFLKCNPCLHSSFLLNHIDHNNHNSSQISFWYCSLHWLDSRSNFSFSYNGVYYGF